MTDEKTSKLKLKLNKDRLLRHAVKNKSLLSVVGNKSGSSVRVEIKGGVAREGSKDSQDISISQIDKKLELIQQAKELKEQNAIATSKAEKQGRGVIENNTSNVDKKDHNAQGDIKQTSKVKNTKHVKHDGKSDTENSNNENLLKAKIGGEKKLKKSDIFQMLSEDELGIQKTRSLASIKRARNKERRKMMPMSTKEKIYRDVVIPETITIAELASRMSEQSKVVMKELASLGVLASVNHSIDADTAELVVSTLGHKPIRVQESDIEDIINISSDDPDNLITRDPVVTIMGHVDHGKTSLLDALRSTDVALGEHGGITQHIGAYNILSPGGKSICFIDTPGHEAFSIMRSQGAKITDLIILVVAADDGIKAQTVEAINHAKKAEVPIILAINKIDKPEANIAKVTNELLQHSIVAEELGGETMLVPISATKKQNLDKLIEAILLQAELLELKAQSNCPAGGVVIDSRVDKGRGVIVTLLVQRGVLRKGDLIVVGTSCGRVKTIVNDRSKALHSAYPCEPVEILGLDVPPPAGAEFAVLESEKRAKEIISYRKRLIKDKKFMITKSIATTDVFHNHDTTKTLSLIIRADVSGSLGAIISSIEKISGDKVNIKIIHQAVGNITESDIVLASTTGVASIIGFNIHTSNAIQSMAAKYNIDIQDYTIIYELIDNIRIMASDLLDPLISEELMGTAEVREVFNITGSGTIAGSYVNNGTLERAAKAKVTRDNVEKYSGILNTIKRFKDDVKEVKEGYECGLGINGYSDFEIGDIIAVYKMIKTKQKL